MLWLAVLHALLRRRRGLAHGCRRALSAGLTGAAAALSFAVLIALLAYVPGHGPAAPRPLPVAFGVLVLAEVAILGGC
ncbi:hypothetical protein ALI22I_43545 [Saccharothrix sp. ALI-22-I]|nr:hypothetical protein ALI22I_43545 [Saccharothrix sp. ALI-22-I]